MRWIQRTVKDGEVAVFVDDNSKVIHKIVRNGFLWMTEQGEEYVEIAQVMQNIEDEYYRRNPRLPDVHPEPIPEPELQDIPPGIVAAAQQRVRNAAGRLRDEIHPAGGDGQWAQPQIFNAAPVVRF